VHVIKNPIKEKWKNSRCWLREILFFLRYWEIKHPPAPILIWGEIEQPDIFFLPFLFLSFSPNQNQNPSRNQGEIRSSAYPFLYLDQSSARNDGDREVDERVRFRFPTSGQYRKRKKSLSSVFLFALSYHLKSFGFNDLIRGRSYCLGFFFVNHLHTVV